MLIIRGIGRIVKEEEDDDDNNDNKSKIIRVGRITGRSWLTSSCSITLTLPKHLAEKHGLVKPCTILFEDNEKGILIRRLKV